MRFQLLGPFEARTAAGPVALGSPQQRVVLAALLLEPNRVVPMSRLIDMLWADGVPATARNALQVYVSRLRSVLRAPSASCEARIERVGVGYRAIVDLDTIDLHRFRALVALARGSGGAVRAVSLLRRALALWRGQPLADLDNWWLRRHVSGGLKEAWLHAYEELFELELKLGNHRAIVPEVRQLLAQHPTDERLAALLMRALCRAGRRADALAAYRRASQALGADLGVEPGRLLEQLHLAIMRDDPALSAAFSDR